MEDKSIQVGTTNERDVLAVLMDTADGAFAIDREGRILLWNEAAHKITGRRADEVIGRACCQVIRGRDSGGNLVCFPGCHVKAMANRGEHPTNHDLVVTDATGRELSLDVSTVLVRDGNEALQATVHLFRNVTARRHMESHFQRILGERSQATEDAPESVDKLTAREREVLKLLSSGLPTHAIANRLSLSRATVRNHIQNILNKLGVHSKLEAVVLAHKHHLE
jgi:PAS domain S-box-containing protein